MKKYLLFIFTLLYLGIATGANLSYSYCMGRLVEVNMAEKDAHAQCGMCNTSDSESKDCCKHEQHFVKLSVDQNTPLVSVQDFTPAVIALLYNLNHQFLLSECPLLSIIPDDDSPQPIYSAPLFVRNCVFLI